MVGIVVMTIIPLLIYTARKPHWNVPDEQGRGQVLGNPHHLDEK